MDDGKLLLEAQKKLLHLFLMFDNKQVSEYQRALILSIMLWSHHKRNNDQVWKMFASNACAFNEESGEICFSVLARGVARSGIRSDVNAVSKSYRLIRPKMRVAMDIGVDICGEDFKHKNNHNATIKASCKEVKSTAAFFSRMIRALKAGRFQQYTDSLGVPDEKTGIRPTEKAIMVPKLDRDVRRQYNKVLNKLQKSMQTFWVCDHNDVWPDSVPVAHCDSDDEEVKFDTETGDPIPPSGITPPRPRRSKRSREPDVKPDYRQYVGRIVRVPARQFGAQWATETFGRAASHSAVLHARVMPANEPGFPNYCSLLTLNHGDTLSAKFEQIVPWLVSRQDIGPFRDTSPRVV